MRQPTDSPPKRFFDAWRLSCLAVLIVSCLVYLRSLGGLLVWDDHALIGGKGIGGGNSFIACFTQPFLKHYFRPLVSLSFCLDHKLWGSTPFYYHQTNILIHVLTTACLIALLHAAFRSRAMALAGGLAFALQPAQVSTVAWVGGRTDSLCTLLMALFAWTLIRGVQSAGRARAGWIAASTVSFGLALLAKEQIMAVLVLVPLAFYCFAPGNPRENGRDGVKFGLPFLFTGVAFVALWCLFYPAPFKPVVHSLPAQLALAGRSMTYYTVLLLTPTPQSMHMLSVGSLDRYGIWSVLSGYLLLAVVLGVGVRWLRVNPRCAWFLAYILVTLLPVCNLIPLPSLVVAPYRVGTTGLGVAALLGVFVGSLFHRLSARYRRAQAPLEEAASASAAPAPKSLLRSPAFALAQLAVCGAFLLWYGALTVWGTRQWQDEHTIYSTIARSDPESIIARYNLAATLLGEGQNVRAVHELENLLGLLFGSQDWRQRDTTLLALQRHPGILTRVRENQGNALEPKTWLAELYAQLGFARLNCRDKEGGQSALAIGYGIDRTSDSVNVGLAEMAYDRKDYVGALKHLRIAAATAKERPELHMLLGRTLAAEGRWREAREELKVWAQMTPWSGQAYIEEAQANSHLGDYSEAKANLEYALHHSVCDAEEVRARLADLHGRAAQSL